MRVLIATDAWRPQVNGVVRTYEHIAKEAAGLGADVTVLTPDSFSTLPCPTYPEIRLSIPGTGNIARAISEARPDAIHIGTEGPIGWMVRAYCRRRGLPFTTSYHTRFPEYLRERLRIPPPLTRSFLRRFHNSGAGTMVATRSLALELERFGFKRLMPWTRGVDTHLFAPRRVRLFGPAPVFLYVGRVAAEKNIEAFLKLDLPGRKVVVGAGPELEVLKARYPSAVFTGKQVGEELARCYASSDVFVFPSRTDTFGMVILEALASGLPVAAYPVMGPVDLIAPGVTGVLSENLGEAATKALDIDRERVRQRALSFSWQAAARMFLENIESALSLPSLRRSSLSSLVRVRKPAGSIAQPS